MPIIGRWRPPPQNQSPGHYTASLVAGFGGAWISLIGFVWAGIAGYTIFQGRVHFSSGVDEVTLLVEAALGFASGLVILYLVRREYAHPENYRTASLLIIGCSLVSFAVPPSGLFIGPAVAGIGGILMTVRPP